MDLQLQSWKEFEEQDLVIKLLIVDNSFCIMTELLCVYFSENFTVKQCQDQQEITQQINLQRLGCRGILVLTEMVGYLWNNFSKLQQLHFHKIFPQICLSLRWLQCCSKMMSIVKRLSKKSCHLVEDGIGLGACTVCHEVHPGSLHSCVPSFWVGQGALMGPFSAMTVSNWFLIYSSVIWFIW